MNTFVIAEAGANHNRNFEQALALIDAAKTARASAVKFQTYSSETLYAKNTKNFAGYKDINQLIKDIELPREWQSELKSYCDSVDIEFMSTPFDEKAVEELVDLGVKRLKIAGFESTDWRFVDMVASSGLPLIVSAGIGFSSDKFPTLFKITEKYSNDLTVLHCNNAYPTPPEDSGLCILKSYKSIFDDKYKIGLSDHTTSTLTPALAVAAGASTIEKHFTLSRLLPGPDHPFALEPDQLCEMVSLIDEAEACLFPSKLPSTRVEGGVYSQSEFPMRHARRSVVALSDIKEGESLTLSNITTKRPYNEGNVPASDFFRVLGARAQVDIKEDVCLKIDQIFSPYEACVDMWSGG